MPKLLATEASSAPLNQALTLALKSPDRLSQIAEAAQHFATPAYVYDQACIEASYQALQKAIGTQVEIFYSIKANPNIAICQTLREQGANTEVCSLAELETVLMAGFKPHQIIFVGPHKSEATLKRCLELQLFAIVIESFEEIERLAHLAEAAQTTAAVLLRINPEFCAKSALLKMGGKPSQFGIDEPLAKAAIHQILDHKTLSLLGIHIYNGTRILSAETLAENTAAVLAYADELQKEFNLQFPVVDFGGGAGIPYFPKEEALNMQTLEATFKPIIDQYLSQYPGTRLIMESGRYLVGSSGYLVLQVDSIKQSKGETFVITDGGTNCHMAAVGVGSIVRNNFPVIAFNKSDQAGTETVNITGPLCTPGDVVAKKITLPKLEVGDLIAITRSGAYGPTASPTYFLSHGFPNEVLVKNNQAHLIRSADRPEDILKNQFLVLTHEEKTHDNITA